MPLAGLKAKLPQIKIVWITRGQSNFFLPIFEDNVFFQLLNHWHNSFLNGWKGPTLHCVVVWETQKSKHSGSFSSTIAIANGAKCAQHIGCKISAALSVGVQGAGD